MAVKKGDKVKLEYTGSLEDGTVFDSTEKHGSPIEFEVGAGQVLPALENAVVGMKQGEEKEVKLAAKNAFGEHVAERVRKVPRNQLPQDRVPEVGMVLAVGLPNGSQFPVKIVGVSDEHVDIDMNHPLAGKDVVFKIKLVGVS